MNISHPSWQATQIYTFFTFYNCQTEHSTYHLAQVRRVNAYIWNKWNSDSVQDALFCVSGQLSVELLFQVDPLLTHDFVPIPQHWGATITLELHKPYCQAPCTCVSQASTNLSAVHLPLNIKGVLQFTDKAISSVKSFGRQLLGHCPCHCLLFYLFGNGLG